MTNEELIQWLRDNSSGIYRPSEMAADRMEAMIKALENCVSDLSTMPRSLGFEYTSLREAMRVLDNG